MNEFLPNNEVRKIILSEDVRQETPPAFMVFCFKDIDSDYMIFGEEREARDFAFEQEDKFGLPEDSVKIYALWAGDWK